MNTTQNAVRVRQNHSTIIIEESWYVVAIESRQSFEIIHYTKEVRPGMYDNRSAVLVDQRRGVSDSLKEECVEVSFSILPKVVRQLVCDLNSQKDCNLRGIKTWKKSYDRHVEWEKVFYNQRPSRPNRPTQAPPEW